MNLKIAVDAEHANFLESLIGKLAQRLLQLPGVLVVRVKLAILETFDDCEMAIRQRNAGLEGAGRVAVGLGVCITLGAAGLPGTIPQVLRKPRGIPANCGENRTPGAIGYPFLLTAS